MNKSYIVVLDSGIGGISVLNEMQSLMPRENYIYIGDNKNVPYGNKTERALLELTLQNLRLILDCKVKVVVLGCNTLSVCIGQELAKILPQKVFGVYPPVESEIMKNRKTLLLSTTATAKHYSLYKNLTVVGLKNLASDIENNAFSLDKINVLDHREISEKKCSFDSVILGCSHYEFVKNKIFNHFCPKNITSGNAYTARMVYNYLKNTKSLEKYCKNEIIFLGNNAHFNKKFYFEVVKSCFSW